MAFARAAFIDRLSLPPSLSSNFCGFYASAVGATAAAAAAAVLLCGQLRRLYHRGRRRPRRRRRRRGRARVPRRPAVEGRGLPASSKPHILINWKARHSTTLWH